MQILKHFPDNWCAAMICFILHPPSTTSVRFDMNGESSDDTPKHPGIGDVHQVEKDDSEIAGSKKKLVSSLVIPGFT